MKPTAHLRQFLALAGSGLLAVSSAQAQLTWDPGKTGSSDGAGTYLATDVWFDGVSNVTWDNVTPASAIIGNGGVGGTITMGTVNAGSVLLNNFTGTYNISGGSLSQSDGITIGASAGNVTFSTTPISGAGGITMNGSSLLTIRTGTMTYTGPTTINSGVVMLGSTADRSTGNFSLNGGMLTDYYRSTHIFSSGLGTGANQIQIYGNSGFGGGNGASNWRIGAQNSVLTWGVENEGGNANATGFFNPTTLKFRAPIGDNNGPGIFGVAVLQNRLDLNSGTRTIDVLGGTTAQQVAVASSTISAGIQDTGATGNLIKTGDGNLVIGGTDSTLGGTTTINGGMIDFGSNNIANIGGGSGRNISVAAGAGLRFNALSNAIINRIVVTTDEISVMSGATGNNLDFSSTGANLSNAFLGNWAGNGAKAEMSGTITAGSNGYKFGATGSNGLLGIRGILSGANSITIGGTGATGIRVNIVAANTHTGATVINTGSKLTIGNNLALQNSALNVGSAGGTFALAAGTNGGRITGETETASPTFGGLIGSRNLSSVFTTSGGNNETNLTANNITGFTLNVGTGNTFTYSGAIGGFGTGTSNNNGGGINGNSTLTKTGLGTQILSGTSTYTGGTNVDGGTLIINGNITTSTLTTVADGATIGGSGTVGALTVQTGGFITPGNSTGILNTGAYTQQGLYTAEINGLTPGTLHDQINVTGTVDMTGGSLATLFTGSYALNDMIFILLNDGTDTITGTFTGLSQGAVAANYGGFNWQISYLADSSGSAFTGGNDIALMATVIPEPSSALLGALGAMLLLRRRR